MQDVIDETTTGEPAAPPAAFLDSVLAGLRVEQAEQALMPAEAPAATREENLSAVSPLAYLAALLDYTFTHLRNGSEPVDLGTLDATLHQPFGDLPTAGEAVDRELRQVRLVVEVLRRYLDPSGPVWPGIPKKQKDALAADERSYRQAAYAALLFRLGTSYDELLLARGADAQARQNLADRLGLDPARLNALCLDLATLAEADLERLFGLADTTRDRLSEGAKSGDAKGQVVRWDLDGAVWGRATDADGRVHLRLSRPSGGPVTVEAFRDAAGKALVARGEAGGDDGAVLLEPQNQSGLSGELVISYSANATGIALQAIPTVLAWQLERLRERWRREDWPETEPAGASPLLDPDLVPADHLVPQPPDKSGNDWLQVLWSGRKNALDTWLGALRNAREGKTPAAGLEAMLAAGLSRTWANLEALEEDRKEGTDIGPQLQELGLTPESFARLIRIGRLAASGAPPLQAEWSDLENILVQARKRRSFAAWRTEEKTRVLLLGPGHFRIPPAGPITVPPPAEEPPAWRATAAERRAWRDRLQARIDHERSLATALAGSVGAAEEAALPALRDDLILASVPENAPHASWDRSARLEAQGKWVTDRLLIDARSSPCQKVTRIGQAIETLQALLFSVRTGQLRDTYPFALAAPDFDQEWEWIGSYAAWRAAMFVFLFPENVLRPALRRRQSPGLLRALELLRTHGRPTPPVARQVARLYADYFQDVANLSVGAWAEVAPSGGAEGEDDSRPMRYYFARNRKTPGAATRVYWGSRPAAPAASERTVLWHQIPGLSRVVDLPGAALYQPPSDSRYLYLFARVEEDREDRPGTRQRLVFTRYNLDTGVWMTQPEMLEQPDDLTGHRFWVKQTAEGRPYLGIQPPSGVPLFRGVKLRGDAWLEEHFPDSGYQPGWQLAAEGSMLRRVVKNPSGRLEIVAEKGGSGGTLYTRAQTAGGAWRDGYLTVTPTGPDGRPYQVTDPGIAQNGAGQLEIVAKFRPVTGYNTPTNENIWRIRQADPEAGTWSAWENLGNPSPERTYEPAVGVNPNGLLEVFVSGGFAMDASRLWRRRQRSAVTWEDWKEVTSPGGDIVWKTLARSADGRLELLLRVGSGILRSIQTAPGSDTWTAWEAVSGFEGTPGRLVIGQNQNGLLEAFLFSFVGTNVVRLYRARQTAAGGPWGPWTDLGLPFQPLPLSVSVGRNGDGCLDLFVVAPDKAIWHRRQTEPDGTQWTAWHNLTASTGGETASSATSIATVLNAENRLELFRNGPEGSIWSMVVPFGESQGPAIPDADLVPVYAGPYELTESRTAAQLQEQRGRIRQAYEQSPAGARLYLEEAWYALPVEIALELQRQGHHTAALDWFRTVYDYGAPLDQRKIFHGLVLDAALPTGYGQAEGWLEDPLDPHAIAATRRNAHTRFTLMSLVGSLREFADAEFTRDTAESLARARTLYLTGLELLADLWAAQLPGDYEVPRPQSLAAAAAQVTRPRRLAGLLAAGAESLAAARAQAGGIGGNGGNGVQAAMAPAGQPLATPELSDPRAMTALSYAFWVPPNPMLEALRLHIEINLYKLRTCRNIAGLLRDTPLYSAPVDTVSGLPVLGAGGQIALPGTVTFQPTPYRFAVLLERARQLANLAQQMESALLGALERRDAEAYSLIQARQDVAVANSQVRWHDMRVQRAGGDVRLAELQLARSELQAAYYSRLISEGELAYETQANLMMLLVTSYHATMAAGLLFTGPLGPAASSAAQALSNEASRLTTLASYERRRQEWQFQVSLARQEVLISTQQVASVNQEVRLVQRERDIAKLQADNAAATADFLAGKFTNYELYDWMSGVLRGVYAFFLQQATAMARLAARQLAFERQETTPAFFQEDYWTAPTDGSSGTTAPDRQGMTGSARLQRDLQQLDQHAFTTDRRKLQLTKTVSLARLAPVEFQVFRETGEIYFATPLEMFDRDFPGHWLRLIKQVRTSVIALIPPAQGIRATFSTTGVTRIVTSETSLGMPPAVNQGARSVALSAPMGATGLFELDPQSDMLAPFEGLGVDTQWRLALPKAANPFDFGTIADVLVTIEYTALDSPVRRPLVIQQLDPRTGGARPFSFRHQFADQWYDLHNADPGKPATLQWRTVQEDFPPNLEQLKIQEVALYFSRREGVALDTLTFTLRLRQEGHEDTGGPAQPREGLIDTRRSSGTAWTGMRQRLPWGTWELTVPAEALELFASEKIADVLFVITWEGRTPEWI